MQNTQDTSLFDRFNNIFSVVKAKTDEDKEQAYRLRYQVYCIENDFEPRNKFHMEKDQYEHVSEVCLLKHRPTDTTIGSVRLVGHCNSSTYKLPMLHNEKIRSYLNQEEVILSAEISRFCISKNLRDQICDPKYYSCHDKVKAKELAKESKMMVRFASMGLVQAIIQMMKEKSITEIYSVMEPFLIRLLSKMGIPAHLIGDAVEFHGLRHVTVLNAKKTLENAYRHNPSCWSIISQGGLLESQHFSLSSIY